MSHLTNKIFCIVFVCLAVSSWQADAQRILGAGDMSLAQDQTDCLSVTLAAQGEESALGFSLCFDASLLTFVSAQRGPGASTASWNVNTNQAPNGRLGFALTLPDGQTFAPGSNSVIEVCFRAASVLSTVITPVSLCDTPIGREVVDADGLPLEAVYADGSVTVVGSCAFALGTNQESFGASGGTGQVEVSAGPSCAWSAVSESSWIAITSAANGSGHGLVSYTVAPNPLPSPRTGLLRVAGEPFAVIQAGVSCVYALDPTNRVHPSTSEAALISVTTLSGCAWTVLNTNDWILIKLTTNGTGSGTVRYTVLANPNPSDRSGWITIGGELFSVSQLAAPCSYTLLPTDRLFGPDFGTGTVSVFTVADCTWTVSNTNRWITITSATNGAGFGTVSYSVAASLSPNDRTGLLVLEDQTFTVTQLASPCWYALSRTNLAVSYTAASGTVNVTASTGCTSYAWSVINPNDWISITSISNGVSRGSVSYTVAPNPRTIPRTGEVNIAERSFTISQAGLPCTYALSPTNAVHGYLSEFGLISVITPDGCNWTVRNTNSWITITSPTNGTGSGTVGYAVADNPGATRTGTLVIGGVTFTVKQGEPQAPSITGQPASQNVVGGTTVVFHVNATGSPLPSYQWRFNGTNLADDDTITGAATATLTLFNVQPTQAGNYAVVASNFRGSVTSAPPAVLRVNTAPVLLIIPDKIVNRGTTLAFTAAASDADIPRQTLTYSLDPGAPSGASLNPATGLFTWTPSATLETSTNRVTIRVTDNGLPSVSAAQSVAITVVAGFTSNVTLVATGSVWKYFDTGQDPGPAWTGLAFDDRAWPSGPAELGYGNGDEATVVSYGPDAGAKFLATYFRRSFPVIDPSVLGGLNLRLLRDDGVVVYLNGAEVFRDNMPAGPINYLTPASGSASDDGTIFLAAPPVDPGHLVPGDNEVAVEIHQRSGSSSDIAFELEMTATESIIAPVLTAQPQSQSVVEGFTVTFNAAALGAPPLNYEWRFNNAPAAKATTSATLTLPNLQVSQSGGYFVIVTNAFGATTSAVATLTVTPNRPPELTPSGNKSVAEDSLLLFTVHASDPDYPAQRLTFSLDPGAPIGATINPTTGVFTWTPTEAQGPSANLVTIRVTDDGTPALSASETIWITVSEVNTAAPVLAPIGNKTVAEGSLLSFRASATDADLPAQNLTFSLDPGAPSGASINPADGQFSWTPSEAQGPATNTVTIRVTDDGFPPFSDFETITIIVQEAPTAPVLADIGEQTVAEGALLTFTASASDADLPAQRLTYSLDPGAPAGATVNPTNGLFTWTPTEAQGPSTNRLTIRVTDDGSPPLSDFRVVTIVVEEVNTPPWLAAIGNQTVTEGRLLTFAASASDRDLPAQLLTFSLDPGAPGGAAINPATGVFTWTPTEAQGPSTNVVTIRVTDNGAPAQTAFETILVTVKETNSPPVLAPIWNKLVKVGGTLSFTISATDADLPGQTLTCSLGADAPAGAHINPSDGVFTWTPTDGQGPSTNTLSIRVVDDGSPPLSATQRVTIIVLTEFTNHVSLIAPGAVWKYRDTGEDLGTAWTAVNFEDSAWPSGPAPIGYGQNGLSTEVSYGPDASAKYFTTYFRRAFTVSDPTAFGALNLSVRRDDGVVVYLNGSEVFRDNLPAGPIDYLTPAATTAADAGTTYLLAPPLDTGLLFPGANVVAAEIHQKSGTSSDIVFDLELTGAEKIVAASGAPVIRAVVDLAGAMFLSWVATPGRIYRVQYTSDLHAESWIDLQGDILATKSLAWATDSTRAARQRFYRVIRLD